MEQRLEGHDIALDVGPDDHGDDHSFSPIAYLEQHGADPAAMLEKTDWEDRKEDVLMTAMANLDDRSRDILTSRWLNEEKLRCMNWRTAVKSRRNASDSWKSTP